MPTGGVGAGRTRKKTSRRKSASKKSSRIKSNIDSRRSRSKHNRSKKGPRRASTRMNLTDLQNMAASLGIPHAGVSVNELARRINIKLHQ